VVAVVVYIEDGDLAIRAFELDCRDVVGARDVDVLPASCFEGFADPYYGPDKSVIPTSVLWEDGPVVGWSCDGVELVGDMGFLY